MSGHLTREEKQEAEKETLRIRRLQYQDLKRYLRDKYIAFKDNVVFIDVVNMRIREDMSVSFGTAKTYVYSLEKIKIRIHKSIDDALSKPAPAPVNAINQIDYFHVGREVSGGNFKLIKKIESLDEFWAVINTERSFFARHRMYPTAFFFSWQIKSIAQWIKCGFFWVTEPIIK